MKTKQIKPQQIIDYIDERISNDVIPLPVEEMALSMIEEYAKQYANQSKWVSVEERLPEHGGEYLVVTTKGIEVCYYNSITNKWGYVGSDRDYVVSYYQELPPHPTH